MTADVVLEDVLAELKARYAEPQRAYHTWDHVEALLRWFEGVRDRLHDPEAVRLAILFHDAIYDPTRSDNEALSAELLRGRMTGRVASATLERAVGMVEATAKHLPSPDLSSADAEDLALFLDMDLSILGAPEGVFDAYERNVRTEYAHVPDEAFRAGRTRILRTFAEREQLYFSDWGRERFEAPTRANIARSLTALEGTPARTATPLYHQAKQRE